MSGSLAPVTIKELRWLFDEALLEAGWRPAKLPVGIKVVTWGNGDVVPFIAEAFSRSGRFRFDAYLGVVLSERLALEFGSGHLSCHTANYPAELGLRPMATAENALLCLPAWIEALGAVASTLPDDESSLRDAISRDNIAGRPARFFLPIT